MSGEGLLREYGVALITDLNIPIIGNTVPEIADVICIGIALKDLKEMFRGPNELTIHEVFLSTDEVEAT